METKVAVMSIIVEDSQTVDKLNARNINIISIALDAPQDTISTMAGKIGNLPGISVKTALSGVPGRE